MQGAGESSQQGGRGRNQRRRRYRLPTPSPSPSPPQSPPHPFDVHFPEAHMRERYENRFYARPVLMGKDYEWDSLNEVYNFNNALAATGLLSLFQFPNVIYPDLVRVFYSNATTKEVVEDESVTPWIETRRSSHSTVTTFMFNTVIRITPTAINDLLHTPDGGERADGNWDMSSAFPRICGAPVCEGESAAAHLKHVSQNDLTPICRLIHHMICYDICPKRNTNNLSVDDVFLIDAILQHRPVDVGYVVIRTFQRVLGRRDTHLAYGRLITAFLTQYGFDLSGYAATSSKGKFKKADIQSKMHFMYDSQSNQYYRARDGGAGQAGQGQQNPEDDVGVDLDLNIEELGLPWYEEPMQEQGQSQDQAHHQQQPPDQGEFSMRTMMEHLEKIQKTQEEHGGLLSKHNEILEAHKAILESQHTLLQDQNRILTSQKGLLENINSRYDQITKFQEDFSRWAGYSPSVHPPPPYHPHPSAPGGSDGQGGQRQQGDRDPHSPFFSDIR